MALVGKTNGTRQSLATLLTSTILASASCLGLIIIMAWFIGELLVISHSDGRKLLGEVLRDMKELFQQFMAKLAARTANRIKGLISIRSSK